MKDEELGVDLAGSHILVVDDNPKNLQVIGNILKKHNFHLHFVLSGTKVFNALAQTKVDLILLDIKMPEMDGYQVCRKLQEVDDYADIPVIFVTAVHKDEESIAKGFAAGGVDYITKPFYTDELVARIRTHLRLKKYREYLHNLSRIDPLTRLFNRRAMIERIESEQRRSARNESGFSLLLSDIDHFKQVNDQYGHNCGDAVLKGVAGTLKDRIRGGDQVGRWGGEEFLLLLPDTRLDGAAVLAESLRSAVESLSFECEDRPLKVTMTFGVMACTPGDSIDDCIRKADEALYRGKAAGRNRCVAYEAGETETPPDL